MTEHVITTDGYDVLLDAEWNTLVFESVVDSFVTTFEHGDDAVTDADIEGHLDDVIDRHYEWSEFDDSTKAYFLNRQEVSLDSPDEPSIHRLSFHLDEDDSRDIPVFRIECFANGARYGFEVAIEDTEHWDIIRDGFERQNRRLTEEVMSDAMDRNE